MTLKQHPLSAAFPAMHADEYEALKDSILNIGVQQPITLFEGMVVDGWNRYTAANELGMACPTAELDDTDPRDYVLAQNKARRHLNQGQLAYAVAAVYRWKPAHREKGAPGAPLTKTNEELAVIAGTSKRTMQQAKTVEEKGAPKVKEAVKAGEISVKRGAEISKLPVKEQAKAIKAAPILAEDSDYTGPSDAELQAVSDSAKADLDKVMEILESDDPKAELLKENERLRMELAAVKSQRDGYMNQCNELIRRVKSLKKMLEKAQGK
jgi:ParB-like chromosome segregation protein Spo0J